MGCNCGGGGTPNRPQQEYEVVLPSGEVKVVEGEHAARVAVTRAGGGTYSKR